MLNGNLFEMSKEFINGQVIKTTALKNHSSEIFVWHKQ